MIQDSLVYLVNGASDGFHQWVSDAGNRAPNVIANALSASFHRIIHRAVPTPVGSRERVTRYRQFIAHNTGSSVDCS